MCMCLPEPPRTAAQVNHADACSGLAEDEFTYVLPSMACYQGSHRRAFKWRESRSAWAPCSDGDVCITGWWGASVKMCDADVSVAAYGPRRHALAPREGAAVVAFVARHALQHARAATLPPSTPWRG